MCVAQCLLELGLNGYVQPFAYNTSVFDLMVSVRLLGVHACYARRVLELIFPVGMGKKVGLKGCTLHASRVLVW